MAATHAASEEAGGHKHAHRPLFEILTPRVCVVCESARINIYFFFAMCCIKELHNFLVLHLRCDIQWCGPAVIFTLCLRPGFQEQGDSRDMPVLSGHEKGCAQIVCPED